MMYHGLYVENVIRYGPITSWTPNSTDMADHSSSLMMYINTEGIQVSVVPGWW